MIQLIKDIINDTLKTKDKFTNKKIIPNNAFYLAVFMALVDMFTSYKINIEVFYSFCLFLVILLLYQHFQKVLIK